MKTTILIFSLSLFAANTIAQKSPVKFGEISKEELSMTSYDKDSSAAAVILADYGVSSLIYQQQSGFALNFERVLRIKILTKDGLRWGDFSIPLYKSGSDDEKISGLKAVTYNLEDGKIVESKVRNDGIFQESRDDHWNIVKVTCPNVREGSVVEVTYKVNSPFWFNFQDWGFQSSIPTVLSEYRTEVPEYFLYDRYMQGYVSLDVNEESKGRSSILLNSTQRETNGYTTQSQFSNEKIDYTAVRNRWAAYDVPAFKPEPYMTSVSDYMSKINFELASVQFPNQPLKRFMGNWDDINKTLAESEDFGGQLTGNGFLKKITEEITTGITAPADKIAAITHYVKENVLWDGNQRMYPTASMRKVLDEKKGTSAEINFLLASMLEKTGIEVFPVLLSTRDHGLLRAAIPAATQFNYVICLARVGEVTYLLDATEPLLPIGMLPERCLNDQGFLVSKDGFRWISLAAKSKSRVLTSADFALNADGVLEGKIKLDCSGYAAWKKRKKYLRDGEAEYVKDFVGSHAWEITSTAISNTTALQENFTQEHALVVRENMMEAGDMIYVDPFIVNGYKANPFKSEVRQYPVDFGSPSEETFFFKLTIPDNYVLDELPQSKVVALPGNGGRYIYNAIQTENQITITSMFHINKSLFTQVEYPYLREFYNQVVAKQAEQIVLKRK